MPALAQTEHAVASGKLAPHEFSRPPNRQPSAIGEIA